MAPAAGLINSGTSGGTGGGANTAEPLRTTAEEVTIAEPQAATAEELTTAELQTATEEELTTAEPQTATEEKTDNSGTSGSGT